MTKTVLTIIAVIGLLSATVWADKDRTKELDRINAATPVLNELIAAPDKGVSEDILAKARCVAVIPSEKKAGFVFGVTYGKGVATCRTANGWSAPAPIKIQGGSWGAQIGGEAVDVVMLIMNQRGMDALLNHKFKIGADVSGAAGPIGREAAASTDWTMKAEVLTYSRAHGAFAGATLNGAAITQDMDDTNALYGRDVTFQNILNGKVRPPAGTQAFLQTVARDFRAAKVAERRENSSSSTASGSGGVTGALTGRGEAAKPAHPESVARAAGTGAASSPDAATPVSDAKQVQQDLATAIKDKIGDDGNNIVIAVNAKTVRLSGTVPSDDDRSKVIDIARSKAGDRNVDASGLKVK